MLAFQFEKFLLGLVAHTTRTAFPGNDGRGGGPMPGNLSIPLATAASVSYGLYRIADASQNAASLSFANTTSAPAAAYWSDIPSPTNTVTAPATVRRSIAAGLQVAQP